MTHHPFWWCLAQKSMILSDVPSDQCRTGLTAHADHSSDLPRNPRSPRSGPLMSFGSVLLFFLFQLLSFTLRRVIPRTKAFSYVFLFSFRGRVLTCERRRHLQDTSSAFCTAPLENTTQTCARRLRVGRIQFTDRGKLVTRSSASATREFDGD